MPDTAQTTARHLADRTVSLVKVGRFAKHQVTSQTPQHHWAPRIVAKHATAPEQR